MLITGINPIFGIKNLIMDMPTAYIKSTTTNNPFRFIADIFTTAANMVSNSEMFKEYRDTGGGYTGSINEGSRNYNAALRAVKKQSVR